MLNKINANPSVVSEATELSLSIVLLVAIGLFLGSFALREATAVVHQNLPAMHEAA